MEVDKIYELLGKYGRFQVIQYVLLSAISLPWCFEALCVVFYGLEPPYRCALPPDVRVNESIPFKYSDKLGRHLDKCHVYANFSTTVNGSRETIPCPQGYHYDDVYGNTIVTDWDLVCSDTYKVSLSSSLYMAGLILGGLILQPLADKFGRRTVLLCSMAARAFASIGNAFMPNFESFATFRFINGFLIPGYAMTSFVMCCEVLPADMRSHAPTLGFIIWSATMMLMALLAYLIKNWVYFQLIFGLLTFFYIPYYWLISESLHWLVSVGRVKEADELVTRASKMNGVTLPSAESLFRDYKLSTDGGKCTGNEMKPFVDNDDSLPAVTKTIEINSGTKDSSSDQKVGEKIYTIFHLLKHPVLRYQSLVQLYIWFTNALVYFGLTLFTATMSGNPYINFAIFGAVEIPALLVASFTSKRFGRKRMLGIFHIIIGIPLIILPFLPAHWSVWVPNTLSFIGKFGVTASFLIIFVYGGELYPTVVRSLALGMISTASRVAGVIAPFSIFVERVVPGVIPIIFGLMALVAAALGVLLPETFNKPLMETMEDVRPYTNGFKRRLAGVRRRMCGGGTSTTTPDDDTARTQ